jgi:hypothetical protein
MLPSDFSHLTLLPTGAGESIKLTSPEFSFLPNLPRWFADGKRILVMGFKKDKPWRWWVYDLNSRNVSPVTPEGIAGATLFYGPLIALDQKSVLAQSMNGFSIYPIAGGEPKEVPQLHPEDTPLQWTSDGRGVFVVEGRSNPLRVVRVNLTTGERTLWKEIAPPDPSGIAGLTPIAEFCPICIWCPDCDRLLCGKIPRVP